MSSWGASPFVLSVEFVGRLFRTVSEPSQLIPTRFLPPTQDRDLDCKLEELRRAGGSLSEGQVLDWLTQLLLGLHYMHDR